MKRFMALTCILLLMLTLSACGTKFTTTYSATFTLMYTNHSDSDLSVSNQIITDMSYVITSRSVLQRVIDETAVPITVDQLSEMVSVEKTSETHIYTVCITADDAQLAMEFAQALTEIVPTFMAKSSDTDRFVVLDAPKLTTNGPLKSLFS